MNPSTLTALILAFVLAGGIPQRGYSQNDSDNYVTPLYSAVQFGIEVIKGESVWTTKWDWREDVETNRTAVMHTRGSAWAVLVNGRPTLVTAAHNLGISYRPSPIVDEALDDKGQTYNRYTYPTDGNWQSGWVKYRVHSFQTTTLIGELAYRVKEFGVLAEKRGDVILIKPDDQAALSRLTPIPLAERLPKASDEVTCVGVRLTPMQRMRQVRVGYVDVSQQKFYLDAEMAQGWSGGVVLNSKNQALGVIVSTREGQTTVAALTPQMLSQIIWKVPEKTDIQKY